MSLIISEINSTLFLKGNINSDTGSHLKKYIETLVDTKNEIIINIDAIKAINDDGIYALKSICDDAMKHNKSVLIVGAGSNKIYSLFTHNKSA